MDTLGQVWTWGTGTGGVLGNGLTDRRADPMAIANLDNVVRVAASHLQVIALRADGSVVGWGQNNSTDSMRSGNAGGSTGIITPTVLNVPAMSFIEVASTGNSVPLYLGVGAQGRPLLWGDTNGGLTHCHQLAGGTSFTQPYTPTGLAAITQFAGGDRYNLFLSQSGAVQGCGVNFDGEVGDGTTLSTDFNTTPQKSGPVTAVGLPTSLYTIAAGTDSSAAIDANGDVYTWGRASGGLSGQGDGTLPARNARAVKLAINTGAIASSPATYAGTQSGPIGSATIDVGLAVRPRDVGASGEIYLAVVLASGQLFLIDSNGNLVQYNPAVPIPPFFQGPLPAKIPLNLVESANLSDFVGTTILLGYGLGSGMTANAEMFSSRQFAAVLTLR